MTPTRPQVAAWPCDGGGDLPGRRMAKGAGMIEPHMRQCSPSSPPTRRPIRPSSARAPRAVDVTSMRSPSTATRPNDTVFLLASGASGVGIDEALYPRSSAALGEVCAALPGIVRGGEGATKLVAVSASGAASAVTRSARADDRRFAARKDRIHGADPNWDGCLPRPGAPVSPRRRARHGPCRPVVLFKDGVPLMIGPEQPPTSPVGNRHRRRSRRPRHPLRHRVTCDLSAEYVAINADYRT